MPEPARSVRASVRQRRAGAASHSGSGGRSSGASSAHARESSFWSASIENTLFGVFYLLLDGKKRAKSRLFPLLLVLLDVYSLATLLVRSDLGWPIDSIAVRLNVVDAAIAKVGDQTTLFIALFTVSVCTVWLSIIDAGVVAWSFQTNNFLEMPAQILRLVVQVVITAAYISLLQVLLIPLRCASLAMRLTSDPMNTRICASPQGIAFTSVAAVTLSAFLPLAACAALFSQNDDFHSVLLSGRNALADTAVRTLLVVVAVWQPDMHGALVSVIFFVVMAYMCFQIVVTLPFEEKWVNQLRASTYAVVAWLALITLALSGLFPGADQVEKMDTLRTVAITMVCFMPIAPLLASGVVEWRVQALKAAAAVAADAASRVDDTAALVNGAGSPPATPAARRVTPPPAAGVRFADTPTDAVAVPVEQDTPRALVSALTPVSPSARATLSRTTALFQSMQLTIDDGLVYAGPDVNLEAAAAAHVFDQSPANVRLVALAALHTKVDATVSDKEHAERLRRQLYAKEAVGMAEAVYNLGIVAFTDSVPVRIAYAQFLATYRKDDSRAMGMLQTVSKYTPSVEQRFIVFSYSRTLEQQRQSDDLGTRVNMIGVLAFRQTYRQALAAHQLALKNLLQFWKLVAKMQDITGLSNSKGAASSGAAASATMNETDAAKEAVNLITTKVAALLATRSEAISSYDRLLHKYPGAVILLRTYANFLRDVANDDGGADAFIARAAQAEAEAAPADADDARKTIGVASAKLSVGHTSEHSGGASGGGSSGKRGGSRGYGSSNKTLHVRNDGVLAVQSMKTYMGVSLIVLGLLVVASFVTVRQLQGEALHQVALVDAVSNMAKLAFSAAYWVRTLTMAANDGDATRFEAARGWISRYCAQYKDRLRYLYSPVNLYAETQQLLDAPSLVLREFILGPPSAFISNPASLYELTNDLISSSMLLAQFPLATVTSVAASQNSEYQLVMLNAASTFRSWLDASIVYALHVLDISAQFRIILIVLLVIVFLVVCFMWFAVFMPSVVRVAAAHAGIESVVRAIPPSAVRTLISKYAKKLNQLDALADEVEAAADGGGSDQEDSDMEGPEVDSDGGVAGDDDEDRDGDGSGLVVPIGQGRERRAPPVTVHPIPSSSALLSKASSSSIGPKGSTADSITYLTPRVQQVSDAENIFNSLASPREAVHEAPSALSPSHVQVIRESTPASGRQYAGVKAQDVDELDDMLFDGKDKNPSTALETAPMPPAPVVVSPRRDGPVPTPRAQRAAPDSSNGEHKAVVSLPGATTSTPIRAADVLAPATTRERPRRSSALVQSVDGLSVREGQSEGAPQRVRQRRQSVQAVPQKGGSSENALATASSAPGSRLVTDNSFHAQRVSNDAPAGGSAVQVVPSLSRFSFFVRPISQFLGRTRRMSARGMLSERDHEEQTHENQARRHFSPLLRALMLRVGIALFIALGLQCANFAVNQQDVDFAASKAQSIQVAGTRRAYSGMISMYARELLIGDGAMLDTQSLTQGLKRAVENYAYYHKLLQLGNGAAIARTAGSYGPQDELVFGSSTAAAFRLQNPNASTVDIMVALTSSFGLAAQMNFYRNAAAGILQRFEPWFGSRPSNTTSFNATLARVAGPSNVRMLGDNDLQFILRVDRAGGPLSAQLESSTELFFLEMNASAEQTQTVQIIVFVANLLLLVILQLLVFRRLFRGLYEEATRTEEILAIIPNNVIDSTPALREFFKSETDGLVVSAASKVDVTSKRL